METMPLTRIDGTIRFNPITSVLICCCCCCCCCCCGGGGCAAHRGDTHLAIGLEIDENDMMDGWIGETTGIDSRSSAGNGAHSALGDDETTMDLLVLKRNT